MCNNEVYMGKGYLPKETLLLMGPPDNPQRHVLASRVARSLNGVLVVGNSPSCCVKPEYSVVPESVDAVAPQCYSFTSVSSHVPLGGQFFDQNSSSLRCVAMTCSEPELANHKFPALRHLSMKMSDWIRVREPPPLLERLWLDVDLSIDSFSVPGSVRDLVLRGGDPANLESAVRACACQCKVVVYAREGVELPPCKFKVVIVDMCVPCVDLEY